MNFYPRNCHAIVDARANGMKPAGPVLVVFTPTFPVEYDDAAVYADAGKSYRWDWVRGLGIVVVVGKATKLANTIDEINEHAPCQIDVVDADRHLGWLVCFTRPKLRTVRWPAAAVTDWLGTGDWHREMQTAKKKAAEAIDAERAAHERQFAWT